MKDDNFWLDDPIKLFSNLNFVAKCDMTDNERLNAITRMLIIVSIILFYTKVKYWWVVLATGLLTIILINKKEEIASEPKLGNGSSEPKLGNGTRIFRHNV